MTEMKHIALEDWYRTRYFTANIDISGSGVQDFSLGQVRQLTGLTQAQLDAVVFHDSQTLGEPGLRQAIADRLVEGSADKVMVTNGSTEAIFLVLNTLLKPGDEVVVVDPLYFAYGHLLESIGCTVVRWSLRLDASMPANLEDARCLIGPKTRMVIVNFPHNPTGATLTPAMQQHLIDMVSEVNAFLLWDAVFAEITYDSPRLMDTTLRYSRAISLGSLSKAYGLPGLRVGWFLAAPEILGSCKHLRDYTTMACSPLVEFIAREVITKTDAFLAIRLTQAKTNRAILCDWVAQHRDLVSMIPPQGGVTAFVKLLGIADVEAFCEELLALEGVLLVPGGCFQVPEYVRLGFGGATDDLIVGLAALAQLLTHKRSELLVVP